MENPKGFPGINILRSYLEKSQNPVQGFPEVRSYLGKSQNPVPGFPEVGSYLGKSQGISWDGILSWRIPVNHARSCEITVGIFTRDVLQFGMFEVVQYIQSQLDRVGGTVYTVTVDRDCHSDRKPLMWRRISVRLLRLLQEIVKSGC